MKRIKGIAASLLLLAFLSLTGCLPEIYLDHSGLRGMVVDAETGQPIKKAEITFCDTSTRSKKDGSFKINANYEFTFRPFLARPMSLHRMASPPWQPVTVTAKGYKPRSWVEYPFLGDIEPTTNPVPLLKETSGLRYREATEFSEYYSSEGWTGTEAMFMTPPVKGESYAPENDKYYARGEVRGRVLNAETRKPIANANIHSWIGAGALADPEGFFSLPAVADKSAVSDSWGRWSVVAEGYKMRNWIDTAPPAVMPDILLLPENSRASYTKVKDAKEKQDPLALPDMYAKPSWKEAFAGPRAKQSVK